MIRDITTPVWAIETHREIWLGCRTAHRRAFRSYVRLFQSKRPGFSWGFHVGGFHQEVVHQVRRVLGPRQMAREIEFTNVDERFEVHLDEITTVRFAAVHQQGRPCVNDTAPGQRLLYTQDATVADHAVILVGCTIDPAWEKPPIVSVMLFEKGKRLWKFRASTVGMSQALERYALTG